MRRAAQVLALSAATVLSACTFGPDYRRPEVATPGAYSGIAASNTAKFSRPTADRADLSAWWTQFQDPELNRLVERALAGNLDLQVAASRIRQAREQIVIAGAQGLPHVSADATVARLNSNSRSLLLSDLFGAGAGSGGGTGAVPPISTPSHLNLYSVAFDATWELDVFGGVRRRVEAAKATTESAVWRRRDGEVSLTAEVANDYLTLRTLQQEIAVVDAEVKAQTGTFTIIKEQAQTGFVTRLNVNQQEAQVQATIAEEPELQAQARAMVDALGVLLGQQPESLEAELASAGPLPAIPATLPVGLPSDLLRRRPDVRESERALAAATAAVGVQVANLYPRFNILAAGPSFASTTTAHLFDANNASSIGVGMIQWPIFQGGQVRANIRASRAQADQAYLTYKNTVLAALQNVEDALARYEADQRRIVSLQASVDAAANSLEIANQQYRVGLMTFLNVLQAQTTLLNARNQLVQGRGQMSQDLVSIYKAVGGGWSDADLTPAGKPKPGSPGAPARNG